MLKNLLQTSSFPLTATNGIFLTLVELLKYWLGVGEVSSHFIGFLSHFKAETDVTMLVGNMKFVTMIV